MKQQTCGWSGGLRLIIVFVLCVLCNFWCMLHSLFFCCVVWLDVLTRCVAAVETCGDGHCSDGLQGGAMLNEVGVASVRPPSVS